MSQLTNSVIIIGAGLAGLTAADQILKANPQAQLTILQAMSGPGGRTRSVKINGATFDLGAQWIGHPHTYVQQLAKRAQNQVMIQNLQGKKLIQFGSQKQAYLQDIPNQIGEAQRALLQKAIQKIDEMSKTVPLDHPRNCPYAIQWDSMTIHSWIDQNIPYAKIKQFFQLLVRSLVGCQTNEVSLLFFLWYVHSNHGLQCMMNTEGGLQSQKFVKGTQHMSFYLETEIKKKGGKIFYNSFVNKIVQNKNEVSVSTRNGVTYNANYIIIAAPPTITKKIHFQPQLSRERRFIADRYRMGAYSKMIILYDKQYWTEKGFSGQLLSDCIDGPVLNAYDETKPKQNGQMQPAIVILFGASIEQQWMRNKQQCKKAAVKKLANYFGCPEMMNPLAIEMKVWNQEESVGGAPTCHLPPGVLTKISNLREPQGLIHWAGTQTALNSQGYMNGAIQSGIRVSKQILERFKNQKRQNKVQLPIPSSRWYSQISTHKRSQFSRL